MRRAAATRVLTKRTKDSKLRMITLGRRKGASLMTPMVAMEASTRRHLTRMVLEQIGQRYGEGVNRQGWRFCRRSWDLLKRKKLPCSARLRPSTSRTKRLQRSRPVGTQRDTVVTNQRQKYSAAFRRPESPKLLLKHLNTQLLLKPRCSRKKMPALPTPKKRRLSLQVFKSALLRMTSPSQGKTPASPRARKMRHTLATMAEAKRTRIVSKAPKSRRSWTPMTCSGSRLNNNLTEKFRN